MIFGSDNVYFKNVYAKIILADISAYLPFLALRKFDKCDL